MISERIVCIMGERVDPPKGVHTDEFYLVATLNKPATVIMYYDEELSTKKRTAQRGFLRQWFYYIAMMAGFQPVFLFL